MRNQSGNILFIILLAVVLTGVLTAAIQSTSRPDGASIDPEQLAIRASEVQRYASELERAVNYILQDGKSESDIRFAHYDAHADYGDITWAQMPTPVIKCFIPMAVRPIIAPCLQV